MTDESPIKIYEGGPLVAKDVELALDKVLRQTRRPAGQAVLEGRDALVLGGSDSGMLHVEQITMRTENGRQVTLEDQWIPLSSSLIGSHQPVAVAARWVHRPVCDGSVVEWGVPELNRVLPDDLADHPGAITIGLLGPDGFLPVPAVGDRLDSNRPLLEWSERLRHILTRYESTLTSISVRLSADGIPVLLWSALLQPVLAGLSIAASSLSDEDSPCQAIRRLGEFLDSFATLPERARRLGNRPMAALIERVGFGEPGRPGGTSSLHEQCDRLEHLLLDRFADLERLARSVGIGLIELPTWLYHEGRLYQRARQVEWNPSPTDGRMTTYRIGPAQPSPKAALALLWDLSVGELRLGDVRFEPPIAGASHSRGHEVYLEPLRDSGYHWVEGHQLARASLRVASSARILDKAYYEPAD